MTTRNRSISRAGQRTGTLFLQAFALVFAVSGAVRADELGAFPDPEPAASLERAFWDCERAAVAGMSLDAALVCAELTEEFKRARFGGDFDSLLAYWNERKAAEVPAPAPVIAGADADMTP